MITALNLFRKAANKTVERLYNYAGNLLGPLFPIGVLQDAQLPEEIGVFQGVMNIIAQETRKLKDDLDDRAKIQKFKCFLVGTKFPPEYCDIHMEACDGVGDPVCVGYIDQWIGYQQVEVDDQSRALFKRALEEYQSESKDYSAIYAQLAVSVAFLVASAYGFTTLVSLGACVWNDDAQGLEVKGVDNPDAGMRCVQLVLEQHGVCKDGFLGIMDC